MEIELTRGFKTVIDDDDAALVAGFRWIAWSARGLFYAARTAKIDGKQAAIMLHRVITGAKPGYVVDHIDHDTLNNQRSNLRVCTAAQNMQNSKQRAHSKNKYRNVRLEKHVSGDMRWRAYIRSDNKLYRKWFDDEESAFRWAEATRSALHGEFAYSKDQDSR